MTYVLGIEQLLVTRRVGGYSDHEYVVAVDSTFDILISLQPVGGRILEQLPEGARTRARWAGYASIDQPVLRGTDLATQEPPDLITRDGVEYEVHAIADWTGHDQGLPHHAYVLMAIGDDE